MIDVRDQIISAQATVVADQAVIIIDQVKVIKDQAAIILSLQKKIEILESEVKMLKHKLGLDSNNSSKPPSRDGLGKKNVIPKSQVNNNLSDKKKVHKSRNLKQVENPDHVIDHMPVSCNGCGENLSDIASDKHEARQVFDLPEDIRFIVTEHRLHRKICPCCNSKNYGQAPEHIPGHTQYGTNLGALCIYFYNIHMLPYKRISDIVEAMFGQRVSEQVIIDYTNRFGKISEKYQDIIEDNIRKSEVTHHDETGIRVAGKLHWMLVATTNIWTKYWVSAKRGAVMKGLTGFMVRDCFKPYDSYNPEAIMVLCNAHLLRELEAIRDLVDWSGLMHKMLLLMNRVKHRYLARDKEIPDNLQKLSSAGYDKILLDAHKQIANNPPRTKTPERKAYALLNRLTNRKDDILRFLYYKIVPFTNNLGERDLRMHKVKQKVSGCFRTLAAAELYGYSRGVLVSLTKQGASVLSTISAALKGQAICFPQLATLDL